LTGKAAGDILIKNEPLRPPAASSSPDRRALGKTENLSFSPEPPYQGRRHSVSCDGEVEEKCA